MASPDIGANPPRRIGWEISKSIDRKRRDGFVARYLSGAAILDIGFRGGAADAVALVPQAIGVDVDYPGYDGRTLPFPDRSQDAVFSSHCLEHIADYRNALRDWYRVLKVGGFMVVTVPHQFLYEKRTRLPSQWNSDHKRCYTPASLMAEVEESLRPNSYRLRHLIDHDVGFDYAIGPEKHSVGCYELEMVIERIAEPHWELADPPADPEPATAAPSEAPREPPQWKPTLVQSLVVSGWRMVRPIAAPLVPRSLRNHLGRALWR